MNKIQKPMVTVFTSLETDLNKTLFLKNSVLMKHSNSQFYNGLAQAESLLTLKSLGELILNLESNQALGLGVPTINGDVVTKELKVTTREKLSSKNTANTVARTKDFFIFQAKQPAFMLFDIDKRNDRVVLTRDEVLQQLHEIDPKLKTCGYLIVPSSSSFICDRDENEIVGAAGWHVYVMVNDASLIPNYGKWFEVQAWLKKFGYIFISKNGRQLPRNLVDSAVFSPERLVFESAPTLKSGLISNKPTPKVARKDVMLVLTKADVQISSEEKKQFDELVAKAKAENEPASLKTKQRYVAREAEKIVAKNPSVSIKEAKKQVEQSLSTGKLIGYQILLMDDGTEVTVNDVLADPKQYHLKTLHDPFEPEEGRNRAKIYANDNGSVVLHSQLHGGHSYVLSKSIAPNQSKKAIDNNDNQLVAKSKNTFPYYHVHHDNFDDNPAGVYLYDKQDDEVKKTRISAPLEIVAITADQNGGNFGRRLKITNTLGDITELAMSMAILEKPSELLSELRSKGLDFDSTKKAKDALIAYINGATPEISYEITSDVGWYKDSFIFPHQTIGDQRYQFNVPDGEPLMNPYSQAGDLEKWRKNVASLAIGNPIVIMAISVAFAGALLKKLAMPGLGIHIFGNSSTGKSTTLIAASSVFGKPTDFKRSWKATGNGLEGAAVMYNDSMLALDEIGESDPKELDDSIYRLMNGVGKLRANIKGKSQPVHTWTTAVLSNGEHSVAVHMREGGKKIKAGVEVRMINVPIFGDYGIFNDLHGFENSGVFANHFKQAAMTHFGAAGIEWIKKLIDQESIDGLQDGLKDVKDLIMQEGGFANLNPQEPTFRTHQKQFVI